MNQNPNPVNGQPNLQQKPQPAAPGQPAVAPGQQPNNFAPNSAPQPPKVGS